jgi:propionate CoA-transferase
VLYLTERASFRLTPAGVELFEIAPGIDLQRDVLDQMDFAPRLASQLNITDRSCYLADPQSHF